MRHRPWPYTQRLVDRMADSSLLDAGVNSLQRPPRSEGLHASTLLKYLHPQDEDNKISEAQLRVYGLLGLAFEDRCELALLSLAQEDNWPWLAIRPGEVVRDGIACSPDIILIPKNEGDLRELSIKCTWKSCKGLPNQTEGYGGFPPKFNYYLDQCMTYATPMDTNESVLLAYFVNGDYKGRMPEVHGWELQFTPRERAETWQALLNIKQQRGL